MEMKTFELNILICCLSITIIIIVIITILGKYTDLLNHRGWSRNRYIAFALIMISMIYASYCSSERKILLEIKKEQISPVKATARIERKMPYGIRIYLQNAAHSTYQFDLKDTSLSKEFIEKVNSGYTVSKFRNSTDILLTNGNDSIYYNLYY